MHDYSVDSFASHLESKVEGLLREVADDGGKIAAPECKEALGSENLSEMCRCFIMA